MIGRRFLSSWWAGATWPDRLMGLAAPVMVCLCGWATVARWTSWPGWLVAGGMALWFWWTLLTLRRLWRDRRALAHGDGAPLPRNVRAVMADGREVPLECRYLGWDPRIGAHRWAAVWSLPDLPQSISIDELPAHTAVMLAVVEPP